MNLDEVKNLNKNELHTLRNKVDEILASLGSVGFDSSLIIFYEIIKIELNKRKKIKYPSLHLLKKKNPSLFLRLEKVHLDFIEWLERCCPDLEITEQIKAKAYSYLIEFAIGMIKDRQVDLSLNYLINNLSDFHLIFNPHFPGYVEHGILSLIFRDGKSLGKNGKKNKDVIELMEYQLSGARLAFQKSQRMKRDRLELSGVKYKMKRFEDSLHLPRINY